MCVYGITGTKIYLKAYKATINHFRTTFVTFFVSFVFSAGRGACCEGHARSRYCGAIPGQTLGHQNGHQCCHHSTEGGSGAYRNTHDTGGTTDEVSVTNNNATKELSLEVTDTGNICLFGQV